MRAAPDNFHHARLFICVTRRPLLTIQFLYHIISALVWLPAPQESQGTVLFCISGCLVRLQSSDFEVPYFVGFLCIYMGNKNGFYFLPVNLSYVNLIRSPAKEPWRVEGSHFHFPTPSLVFFFLFF